MEIQALTDKFFDLYSLNIEEGNGLAILAQCVKKISEIYPKLAKAYIETVVDQMEYQVNIDGLIKINKVYYSRASGSGAEFVTPPLRGNTLSSQFTDICEREMFDKLNPVDACITDYNSFDLIPAPTEAGIHVWYEYDLYRDLSEIPSMFEDDLFQLYFFYERENAFKNTMKNNTGNVFKFDRKGNIQSNAGEEDPVKVREAEMARIVKSIKNTAMRMRR